jgi:hypothetical protein
MAYATLVFISFMIETATIFHTIIRTTMVIAIAPAADCGSVCNNWAN